MGEGRGELKIKMKDIIIPLISSLVTGALGWLSAIKAIEREREKINEDKAAIAAALISIEIENIIKSLEEDSKMVLSGGYIYYFKGKGEENYINVYNVMLEYLSCIERGLASKIVKFYIDLQQCGKCATRNNKVVVPLDEAEKFIEEGREILASLERGKNVWKYSE